MTIDELRAKREEILKTIGVVRVQFGERSVQYADQEQALAAIDAEIARLEAAGSTQRQVSYGEFSRG